MPPRVGCSPAETFRATRSIPSLASLEPPAHEAAGGYGSRRRAADPRRNKRCE